MDVEESIDETIDFYVDVFSSLFSPSLSCAAELLAVPTCTSFSPF